MTTTADTTGQPAGTRRDNGPRRSGTSEQPPPRQPTRTDNQTATPPNADDQAEATADPDHTRRHGSDTSSEQRDPNPPNFGKASAAKRGRNPALPYVPIINLGDQHVTRTKQVLKRAFATRNEAIACAQRVIDANIALHETHLATPRYRALREHHGLPRELVGTHVTTTEPTTGDRHPIGVVVQADTGEQRQGITELGLPPDGLNDHSLIEWPDGRRWQHPTDIRIIRTETTHPNTHPDNKNS